MAEVESCAHCHAHLSGGVRFRCEECRGGALCGKCATEVGQRGISKSAEYQRWLKRQKGKAPHGLVRAAT